jgi:hypothetical protein
MGKSYPLITVEVLFIQWAVAKTEKRFATALIV